MKLAIKLLTFVCLFFLFGKSILSAQPSILNLPGGGGKIATGDNASMELSYKAINTLGAEPASFLTETENDGHFHEATGVAHSLQFTSGACVANTVNRFSGSYHSNLYIGNSSGTNVVLAWGQNMSLYITGAGTNYTSPTVVPATSYASSIPLEVRSSSSGGANGYSALVLRTSTKLYFWGTTANLTAITTMASFGGASLVAANSDVTAKLPAGVAITDIKQVAVSQKALAIVTNSGNIYVLTTVQNLQGDAAAASSTIWHQVKLSGGVTALSGVTKLSLSSSGAFALTSANKIYYWGSPANVAGVANIATSYNYAYDMSAQIPAGKTVTDLVVLGTLAPSPSTLFISCNDGKVYATGLNTNGCLGTNNATYTYNAPTFATVKTTDGTTDLTNIVKIDGDTEADIFCMAGITSTGQIYGWGDSPAGMLGVNAATGSFPVPLTSHLFYPTPGVNYTDFSVAGHFTIAFYTNGVSDQYWYLGHNTGGSIGDPANVTTYILSASPASLNASGGVSFDCSNATLPVEFIGFTGKWVNEEVALSWKTATEQNTNYFTVERSADAVSFIPVGIVSAIGSSNSETLYSFLDKTPLSGANYYRLKTVDIDSRFQYSATLKLNKQLNDKLIVSPNPFSSTVSIQITLANKEKGTIRIIDRNGKTVYSSSRILDGGTNIILLNNLAHLSAGTYLVETSFGTVKTSKQIFKSN